MNYALWKQQLSMPEVLDCLEPGTICTPFALIEEIIDKLPINWSNPNLKFLDPTCGRGSFLFVIKQRLLQAGHSEQHIVENMLYGMDIAKRNVDFTKIILDPENKYKNNIEWGDSLTKDWNMKFDVVVGNPPWSQPNTNKRSAGELDRSFYKLFRKLGKTGGIIIRSNFLKEESEFTNNFKNDCTIVWLRDTSSDFNVFSSSVAIVFDSNHNSLNVIIKYNSEEFVIPKHACISVRSTKSDYDLLLTAINKAKTQQTFADRYYRPGSDQYVAGQLQTKGKYKVVASVGSSQNDELIIKFSDIEIPQKYSDRWRVVINAPGSMDGIGCRAKVCKPGILLSQSVIGFYANTQEEAILMANKLNNDRTTQQIIALIKQGNYNSKSTFKFITIK